MIREDKLHNIRKNIIGGTSLGMLGRNAMKIRSIVTIFAIPLGICPTVAHPRENLSAGEQINSNSSAEVHRVENGLILMSEGGQRSESLYR